MIDDLLRDTPDHSSSTNYASNKNESNEDEIIDWDKAAKDYVIFFAIFYLLHMY